MLVSIIMYFMLLSILGMMIVCLAECDVWKREEGIASPNGILYPYMSLSDCLNLCLEMSSCLVVDVSLDVCVLHTNVNDIATTFNASEFTQYALNRACFPSTLTLESSATGTLRAKHTSTGMHMAYVCIQFEVFSLIPSRIILRD